MKKNTVKLSSLVQSQVPSFVRDESPLLIEFLKEYYNYLESPGNPADILQNIDAYKKLDNLVNSKESTVLTEELDLFDFTIAVESTAGFPQDNGLIRIDDEIIYYKTKTETTFEECTRGFSGNISYIDPSKKDSLIFEKTFISFHESGSDVINLYNLLLQEFLLKAKSHFLPGLEDTELYSELNQALFIKQSKDFYSSKGTDDSFKILFKALFGEDINVIRPKEFLFKPSASDFRVTLDLVVDEIDGNPWDSLNRTLYQDQDGEVPKAFGTVTNIEEFKRNNTNYYRLSLDYGYSRDIGVTGSVFGSFSIHPQTQLINSVSVGATVLDVDSTLPFANSGQLLFKFEGIDLENEWLIVDYTSKTTNQFLGCTGVDRSIEAKTWVSANQYVYSYDDEGNQVRMKVNGVLSSLDVLTDTPYAEPNDYVSIKTLGIESNDVRANSWIFNVPISNRVFQTIDEGNLKYNIITFDDCNINTGDLVELNFQIINFDGSREIIDKEFEVSVGSIPGKSLRIVNDRPIIDAYYVRKKLTKFKGTDYNANVQNTYQDYSKNTYVTSHSLPNYFNEDLSNNLRTVILRGNFNSELIFAPKHGFLTGEAVVYNSFSDNNDINLIKNTYFVYKVDNNTFKLSRSRSNLDKKIYVKLEGVVDYAKITPLSNVDHTLLPIQVEPQKLIRKISIPRKAETVENIFPNDRIGIFKNGTEIQTYKTQDKIYYGPIEEVTSIAEGSNYDVLNPPVVKVSDPIGSGFSCYPIVEGFLERIDILETGFDYIITPKITISGGNMKTSPIVFPEMLNIEHSEIFSASSAINLAEDTIDFRKSHKFREGELVGYYSDGQSAIGGLVSGSLYYISVISKTKVSLHLTESEAFSKINPINITSLSTGNHRITSTNYKSIVNSIKIYDRGSTLNNNEIEVPSSGINTSEYTITSLNHRFRSGDEIVYEYTQSPISGLSTTKNYYVSVVDEDNFRLSEKVENSNNPKELFLRSEYVRISSSPTGTHKFKYPPLVINIDGVLGVSSIFEDECKCKLNPVFRGNLKGAHITSSGSSYGSEEIINFNKQPSYEILTGEGALLKPVIYDGKIIDVIVLSEGKNYYSTPDLKILDPTFFPLAKGSGAILTPIISDGRLKRVIVINSGFGYSNSTAITISSPAQGAQFEFKIKPWNINLVESLLLKEKITNDDLFVSRSKNERYGLQYVHIYAPRKLRNMVYGEKFEEGVLKYQTDLQNDTRTPFHSPILGWAYDGNPIYGPYGYDTPFGGRIRQMVSGYEKIDTGSRPNYPLGFFIEDFSYTGRGDLDEKNGRFCITPEFPNGTYAYFLTLEATLQKEGPFALSKLPAFPYIIGDSYFSKYISFNAERTANQDEYGINATKWRRNITPYNLNKQESGYEYLLDPTKLEKNYSIIEASSKGRIDGVDILSPGTDYRVGDQVLFDNTFTGGVGASAVVSELVGKNVNRVQNTLKYFSNVEVSQSPEVNGLIGFCTTPHGLQNRDKVRLVGFSTQSEAIVNTFESLTIDAREITLNSNVGPSSVTGIVTYFNVSGKLRFPYLCENDIFQINSEKIRVLRLDNRQSRDLRILVEREYDQTVGTAHSANSKLFEIPRKFYVKNSQIRSTLNNVSLNREIYFVPQDSVGLGTISGIGYTATLVNPGIGLTQITISSKTIYIPEHGLETGDKVIYNSYDGSDINVYINGITTSLQYASNEIDGALFVAKIDNNIIGLSTVKLGISTDSSFVGLTTDIGADTLFYVGVGTGYKHSFKTTYKNIINSELYHNILTAYTDEDNGLTIGDSVSLSLTSVETTEIDIRYNDKHRRLVVNPKSFNVSDINLDKNTISIQNHGFAAGDKVIYVSDDNNALGGLVNDEIYYVIYITKDTIQLANSYYNSIIVDKDDINVINITSATSSGKLFKINPSIEIVRNSKVRFLLNDPSLSYIDGVSRFSAFEFKLYKDDQFKHEYLSDGETNFQITYNGSIGISENAYAELVVTDKTPYTIYYNLVPLKNTNIPLTKRQIFSDNLNVDFKNSLVFSLSGYSQRSNVVSAGATFFSMEMGITPEKSFYDKTTASISYVTSSRTTTGKIQEIVTESGGDNYQRLVGLAKVFSSTGKDAKIKPKSDSIGKDNRFKIQDIGFDYPSDLTLRPTAKLPDILVLNQKYSFDQIKLSVNGKGYVVPPDLIVKDSATNEVFTDLILSNTESGVTIIKNTNSLSNNTPKFIPINNSNGFSIKNIVFNFSTKIVTVTFRTSFSSLNDFPFQVNDNILIEGCKTSTLGSLGRGFNSSEFNYNLFKILSIDPNIGGSNATITYSMQDYVSSDEILGQYDLVTSSGIVVLEKHFPIFTATIKQNDFIEGEEITGLTSKVVGRVSRWDKINELLKVTTIDSYLLGERVVGSKSGSVAEITEIATNELVYNVDATSVVVSGWKDETGFLNNSFQKIQDGDYYQNFSYSIKSRIPLQNWDTTVNSLNHLSGFKKFSDLVIETSDLSFSGISTSQDSGDFLSIAFISEVVDLDCVYDFDIAIDETETIGAKLISNGMIFNSRDLQDYEESIGNRVLVIDDVSEYFNDRPRPNPYSVVTTFKLEQIRSRKFLIFARDKRFTSERQVYLVTFIHDGGQTYINQYGRVETGPILGSFDFDIFGDEARLLFYPVKFRVNNYDLSFVSYDVKDYISGVGNTSIGNIVKVNSTFTPLNAGITTTIASIPLDYRATKILVQIEDSSNIFEFDEITVIHDGTNVEIIDYGQITTESFSEESVSGIGTYNAYISSGNLVVDLIPNILLDADVNTLQVSIASSASGFIEEGSITLNTSQLNSEYVGISTTSSTSPTKIAEFDAGFYDYNGAYLIVSIEDLTNERYQISECVVASDDNSAYNSEFGVLTTNGEIGIITSFLNGSTTEIYFTADSEIDCEVRVYVNTIGIVDTFNLNNEIDLNNARVSTGYGEYEGTESAIRKSFELFHKGNPIFQKKFNGESSDIIDVANNLVQLPQHFFVTGEKVKYSYEIFNEPIGIATTTISGIGLTDKLPEDLYIVKETDLNVKFASSAQNALKLVPEVLTITSVGFGSEHYITAEKQNAKALISIDNMIQSPIVSTATTTTLAYNILTTDDIINVSNNVEFFKSGDFIKINDELMRVAIVGYGTTSTQIYVNRPWLGTSLQNHSAGDLIIKVVGNYNIVDNVINFASAPYGKYPLGSPENRPDSRDWTGITTNSTFSGRTFMRSGIVDGTEEPYSRNYVFDGIQDQFNGITTAFTLTVDGENITGIEQSNALITVKDIFQSPIRTGVVSVTGNYYLGEENDSTTIYFDGNSYSDGLDISVTGLPVSGKITAVGSVGGFGYQTLVAAAGTAVVSASGTIQSIYITNVGSGYRSGIQTVNVGVRTSTNYSDGYNKIGIASISYGRIVSVAITNPGSGYTSSNPPEVVFDDPLSYSNIDLEYSTTSIGKTTGQNARVNVVVGQGSSVIDFEIIDPGFGYEINNILTVAVGGTTGIPREYRGRLLDGANLLSVNKEFIKNEVVGFITNTYPGILTSTDYDESICKRDIGYVVDAISNDLAFGGNYYSVQAGFAYYIGAGGTSYIDGEKTETIAGYDYITNISQYIINNVTVPVSYQSGISSISQIKDLSIDFDESCSPSLYDENCCSDVWYTIGNYVGIITTIIGLGTAYAPTIQSPYSNPTLSLPTTQNFENFEVTVADTDTDEFTGWTIGDIAVLDDISPLFNGFRTRFPIKINGIQKSIKSKTGSLIDVQSTLLVFINDILQVPGIGYIFKGGSIIRFPEPPKPGNTAKILFYRGTGSIDVRDVDILETVKPGDRLRLHSDFIEENQSERSVKDITATDSVETFPYGGEGIIQNPFLERPVNWCRQKNDLIVDGQIIPKSRDLYEAQINPFTNIISDISIGSTFVYVESLKTFFDDKKENAPETYTNVVDIVTQDDTKSAYALASVTSGIVTSINIQDKGFGYTTIPTVSIHSPKSGINTASATAVIVDGKVDFISINDGGSGYDDNNPPLVLISPPLSKSEVAYQVEYSGDFGFISGIGTTSTGIASTALVFELFIDQDSPLRDASVVGEVYDQSTIQIGDYFVINSTNIGFGVTSLDISGNALVTGNQFIDNVYQVAGIDLEPYQVNVSEIIADTARYASFAIGSGSSVTVTEEGTLIVVDRIKVIAPIEDLNGLVINEFLSREFFGEYTWGKVSNLIRPNPEEYSIYKDNGLLGISTSPIVRRTNALKSINYLS